LSFGDTPPASLHEIDTQNLVIHLNSFSKVLAPGLRLGWLSATPSIVEQIALIKQRLDPHTQNLVQFALTRLLADGSFDGHVKKLRAEHARRCAQMLAAMQKHIPPGSIRVVRPQGGLYLWCRLSGGVSSRVLLDLALAHGVAFVPGHAFYADPAGESELRLCFSSVLPSSIDDAIRKLAVCLQEAARAPRRQLIATA
jgi:DNA-binding transcriptional MocR family regulator